MSETICTSWGSLKSTPEAEQSRLDAVMYTAPNSEVGQICSIKDNLEQLSVELRNYVIIDLFSDIGLMVYIGY